MNLFLDSFSVVAFLLPLIMIVLAISSLVALKNNNKETDIPSKEYTELPLSDPSKEIFVSVYESKKAIRETTRVILERYRDGISGLRNPPEEMEFLAQQLLFAIHDLHSNNILDVMSSLQTLRALGTSNLLTSLQDDFKLIENKWKSNYRVARVIQSTKQRMQDRLENEHKLKLFIEEAKLNEYSSPEKEKPNSLIEISY